MTWWRRPSEGPARIVAHRGASGYVPENTLLAFQRAYELGADAIECDVHLSADGQPVVIHDRTLDRTTSGRGPVSALTVAELRMLDAGAWRGPEFAGLRLPTLAEVLDWARGRLPVVIELKSDPPHDRALPGAVWAVLRETAMEDRCLVISFAPDLLRAFRAAGGESPIGLLGMRPDPDLIAGARDLGAVMALPHVGLVDERLVARAKAAGLGLGVWTVNDPETAQRLDRLGVDAITTDYPDRLRAALRAGVR